MERDSFVFYRSFWEAIKCLPEEEQLKSVNAIMSYALDGIEVDAVGVPYAILMMAKPQIDKNNKRYLNGKNGGKPNHNQTITKPEPNCNQTVTKPKPNHNQTITKPEPNVNVNVNVNDISKDIYAKNRKKNAFFNFPQREGVYDSNLEAELDKQFLEETNELLGNFNSWGTEGKG